MVKKQARKAKGSSMKGIVVENNKKFKTRKDDIRAYRGSQGNI